MKRYLSLWLPDWPLDRLRRLRSLSPRPDKPAPFVLTEPSANGRVIAAANTTAREGGLEPGLKLADARARVPKLRVEEIDRAADGDALRALAGWMVRFSPLVSLDGNDALMLETTGVDHLFGGEAALVQALSLRLTQTGYTNQLGLAGTPGAAFALARAAPGILPEGAEREGLAGLPVTSLRLSAQAVTLLRRFGLTRIGELYGIDRKALARRFHSQQAAEDVCMRLDQALGLRVEPLRPLYPPPAYSARLPCPEPLMSAEGIAEGLRQLMTRLCADLSAAGQGARVFRFHAFRSDGVVSQVDVAAARPVSAPEHVLRLFAEKIACIDPGFGIDLLILEARRTDPLARSSMALSGDLAAYDTDEAALAVLADRITARLGEATVCITRRSPSHLPGRAEQTETYTGSLPEGAASSPVAGPRPVRMLAYPERVEVLAEVPDGPPLRFVWRRILRTVLRADGPERISPEWWQHLPAAGSEPGASLPRTRDYYRVEDSEGRRYWVYREGLYGDGRGAAPEWFVQGFFA